LTVFDCNKLHHHTMQRRFDPEGPSSSKSIAKQVKSNVWQDYIAIQ